MAEVFRDMASDVEYFDWLESNPEGFVVNTDKAMLRAPYPILHGAICQHISDRSTPNYTTKESEWFKVCSSSRVEIEVRVREIDPRRLVLCKTCQRRGLV
ncbi:MAG TPA: hypothetical protein VN256_01305 [Pyrinomonadaceae bacterium]|nr:hypothetical protein [Pyrinomonadaceae bacterium]